MVWCDIHPEYKIYTSQNSFKTVYTQNCIYTHFSPKTVYIRTLYICVYVYKHIHWSRCDLLSTTQQEWRTFDTFTFEMIVRAKVNWTGTFDIYFWFQEQILLLILKLVHLTHFKSKVKSTLTFDTHLLLIFVRSRVGCYFWSYFWFWRLQRNLRIGSY